MADHYYIVIDYECTCWEQGDVDEHEHEIIEFPAVVVNVKTLQVEYEFHRYVKPVENPLLTPFCTELTGISQSIVDDSDDLSIVLSEFEDFLQTNRIIQFTMCTDGPWDFQKFLFPETQRKGFKYPTWGAKWIDVRRRFETSYKLEKWVGVSQMLSLMGSDFIGRPHSGIDDARNIARILIHIHQRDKVSGKIRPNRNIRRS